MGKIIKGVALYTLILIGILVLIAAFIFGLMFFIPKFTPFGWGALNISEKHEDWSENLYIKLQNGAVEYNNGTDNRFNAREYDLEIDAGGFDVYITGNEALNHKDNQDSFLRMRTVKHLLGLVKGDKTVKVNTKMEMIEQLSTSQITYKFKISVNHPTQGAISFKDSALYIEVPTDACFNLSIKTTGGDVTIDNVAQKVDTPESKLPKSLTSAMVENGVRIDNLSVQTGSGDFVIKTNGVGANVLDTDKQPVETRLEFSSVSLKSNGGKFDFSNVKNLKIDTGSKLGIFLIDVQKGDFVFNDINAVMVLLGNDLSITANKIDTGNNPFNYRSTTGYFHIGEIVAGGESGKQVVTIVTNDANIQINKITANGAIINTTYGDISLGTMNGQIKTSTTHGNISIGTAEDTVSASSSYGNITLSKYKGNATLTNSSGAITATFVVSAADVNETKLTKVKSIRGAVTLNNQVHSTELIGVDSATFNVTYNKLYYGDAFSPSSTESSSGFVGINHTIKMLGNSTANIKVPLAEYPIKLVLDGETEEAKGKNNIKTNLVTGVSSIKADKDIAGKLTPRSEASTITLSANQGGSISINSYSKDQQLVSTTNSWFDLYAWNNAGSDNQQPLFPVKYYYEEELRHEYSSSDNEDLNFKWTKKIVNGETIAEASAKVKVKNTNVTALTEKINLVIQSHKYPCGEFVELTGRDRYHGNYKKVGDSFVPLTEEDREAVLKWDKAADNDKDKNKPGCGITYNFVSKDSMELSVVDNKISFYVLHDFDGTALYCKITLEIELQA